MDAECCENITELNYLKDDSLQIRLSNIVASENDFKLASYSIEELNEIVNKLKSQNDNKKCSWKKFRENWLAIFLLILILFICSIFCIYYCRKMCYVLSLLVTQKS